MKKQKKIVVENGLHGDVPVQITMKIPAKEESQEDLLIELKNELKKDVSYKHILTKFHISRR